jgi:DNA-binding CsgD family transcriptional regulator
VERARVIYPLSEVELDVLRGAGRGETVAGTAARLHRSASTIKHHRRSALAKLGARNVTQAVTILAEAPDAVSNGQLKAFAVKLTFLERAKLATQDEARLAVLARASERFGREITSRKQLSWDEAHWCIDTLQRWLDDEYVPTVPTVSLVATA